jgi:hypothetical protein
MSPLNLRDMENNLRIIDEAIVQRLTEEGVHNEAILHGGWSYSYCRAILRYYSDKQLRQAFVLAKYDNSYTSEWRRAIADELEDRNITKILLAD